MWILAATKRFDPQPPGSKAATVLHRLNVLQASFQRSLKCTFKYNHHAEIALQKAARDKDDL